MSDEPIKVEGQEEVPATSEVPVGEAPKEETPIAPETPAEIPTP